MNRTAYALVITLVTLPPAAAIRAQHQGHDPAGAHGASVMGFSQTETSHHFRLSPSGGAIEIHVHDGKNTGLRQKVTTHLEMVAARFAKGDFGTSQAVHQGTPDGAAVMAARSSAITYTYEEGSHGGRIFITTKDAAAREAIHAFLRYQIREHRTGDSLRVLD